MTTATLWTRIAVGTQVAGGAVMIGSGEWMLIRTAPRLDPFVAVAAVAVNLVVVGVLMIGLALLRLIWDRLARLERGSA